MINIIDNLKRQIELAKGSMIQYAIIDLSEAKTIVKILEGDEWVKIDRENLPEGEVLACNEIEYLIGFISLNRDDNPVIICSAGDQELYDVRYYKLLTLPNNE